ncbi:MAG: hypothetical protein IPL40_00695 [Proteobacteria bacterium]|nr:hypothetical protein [Pseudomonadota bacterium]
MNPGQRRSAIVALRLTLLLAPWPAAIGGCRCGGARGPEIEGAVPRPGGERLQPLVEARPPDALRWGLHLSGALLAGRDWSTGAIDRGPSAPVVRRNLDQLQAWRMNLLLVEAVDGPRASLLLPSRTLLARGWSAPARAIPAWVRQAHRRRVPVYLDATTLGRAGSAAAPGLTLDAFAQAAGELLDAGGFDGLIFSSPFAAAWAAASREVARRRGRRFVAALGHQVQRADLLLATIDAGAWSARARPGVPPPAGQGPDPALATDAAALAFAGAPAGQRIVAELGMLALAAGQARARGQRLWVEIGETRQPAGLRHNLLLLAAAQHGATGYLWRSGALDELPWRDEDLRGEAQAMEEDFEWLRRPLGDRRQRAEIVLAVPDEDPLPSDALTFLARALGPVANGLALSGYELHAGGAAPRIVAEAYVVLAAGRGAEGAPDLPPDVLELLHGSKPVLVVVDGLTDVGNWRQALPLLGLRPGWPRVELEGSIERIELADPGWPGGGAATGEVTLRAALIPERAVSGELLASVTLQGARTPLLVGRGNKLLLNASAVPAATAFWINRLLRPDLRLDFDGVGFLGRRSAFLALGDTRLEVDLPLAGGTELRVMRYGADGQRQPIELWPYEPPFKTVLAQHELLVVEGVAAP